MSAMRRVIWIALLGLAQVAPLAAAPISIPVAAGDHSIAVLRGPADAYRIEVSLADGSRAALSPVIPFAGVVYLSLDELPPGEAVLQVVGESTDLALARLEMPSAASRLLADASRLPRDAQRNASLRARIAQHLNQVGTTDPAGGELIELGLVAALLADQAGDAESVRWASQWLSSAAQVTDTALVRDAAEWAQCLLVLNHGADGVCPLLTDAPAETDPAAQQLRWLDLQARAQLLEMPGAAAAGRLAELDDALLEGAARAQALGGPTVTARWLFAHWSRLSMMGHFEQAEAYLRLAIELAADTGDEQLQASLYHGLSISLSALGHMGEMRWALGRALDASQGLGPTHELRRAILSDAGTFHQRLGNYAVAEAYYGQALHALDPQSSDLAFRMAMRQGDLWRRQGEAARAEALHAQLMGHRFQRGALANHELAVALGRDRLALGDFQGAIEVVAPLSDQLSVREAVLLDALAVELAAALALADDDAWGRLEANLLARFGARPPDTYPFRRLSLFGQLMEEHLHRGDLDRAAQYATHTEALLRGAGGRIRASSYRDEWSNGVASALAGLIGVARSRDASAAELFRLLETYYSVDPQAEASELSRADTLDSAAAELWQRYVELNQAMATAPSRTDALQVQASQLRDQLFGVGDYLPPTLTEPLSLAQLQARMPTDHLFVRYFVAGSNSFALLIRADLVQVVAIPDEQAIAAQAAAVQTGVQQGATTSGLALRPFLPVAELLSGITRIVVVADKDLHLLPLELVDWGGPLGERVEFVRAYSASQYYAEDAPAVALDAVDFAVFTNPDFSQTGTADAAQNTDALRSWRAGLAPLPYSKLEADAITRQFAQARILQFSGMAVTPAALLDADARKARIVHISTHGYYDPAVSGAVGLATASHDGGPGFISLAEFLNAPMHAELVVISGCQTMLGSYHLGRGLNSLTRGLATQGAGSVMATLWPVGDRSAAQFVGLFYESLAQAPHDLPAALRRARARAGELYGSGSWSGFTLTATSRHILKAPLARVK